MSSKPFYWQEREVASRHKLQAKTEKQIRGQLRHYYKQSMENTIKSFEEVYNKVMGAVADGGTATVADLYKLDKYWQLQTQLRREAQALGDKTIEAMSKGFEKQWEGVYNLVSIPSKTAFTKVAKGSAKNAIKSVWCADGKDFSARIWHNQNMLVEDLNKALIDCIITGRDTKDLNLMLQREYNTSFFCADRVIRTETAHIDCDAASQRYKDYGIKHIEVVTDSEDGECVGGIYSVDDNPVPFHPNCKCYIIPVIED